MMTILIAVLMILSALVIVLPGMQGREYGMNPAVTSSGNIQPNPTLNTNVSWSIFNSSWNPLEYTNGTANLTLNAGTSAFYANPISIKTQDIISKGHLQGNNVSGTIWNTATPTTSNTYAKTGTINIGSESEPYLTINGSGSTGTGAIMSSMPVITTSSLPSDNLQYDYITYGAFLTGTDITGANAHLTIFNGTANTLCAFYITPGQSIYFSLSLAQLQSMVDGKGFNITGSNTATQYLLKPSLNLPAAPTTDTLTLTVFAFALTEYPITLGLNSTGATPTNIIGSAQLASFHPSEPMVIYNNGYSVAVSQPLQNLTTQQSAVSTLNYIEQVEYQGQFNLPTAPDLSYGSANITERFNVSTSQTQVLDINGVSYLSTISGKNNTVLLLSSVNPNGQTQFLQIVDYTQSQWTSISSPPGIFTLAGIEYYWEEFIIAVLAIVGVGGGAAARHASNLRKVK